MVEVRLEGVSKVFDGRVAAVRDIDLTIESGEFMVLLGPSGSGKTTILYMVAGLYKPTSGRIYFDDEDVTDVPPMKRNVGLVFQNYALYPHMKVYDNIAFPLKIRRAPEDIVREKVKEVASMLRIDHLLDRYPWQLSGGQQQRVAIARALVKEPRVLLLDEPLSNLDALLRLHVRSELKKLQKQLGLTTIHVTHDQGEAMALADRIAVINEGRLQQIGPPRKVFDSPYNTFVAGFLGTPPMNLLEGTLDREEPVAYVKGGEVEVPEDLFAKAKKLGVEEAIVGFRPEYTRITLDPPGIPGRIYTVEPMGKEILVVIEVGEEGESELVRVVTDYTAGSKLQKALSSESLVYIRPIKEYVRLFHPESRISLEYL